MTYNNLKNVVSEIAKGSNLKLPIDMDKIESLKEFCEVVDYLAEEDKVSEPKVYKAEGETLDVVVEFERYYIEISNFEPSFSEICDKAKKLEFESVENDHFKVKVFLGNLFKADKS